MLVALPVEHVCVFYADFWLGVPVALASPRCSQCWRASPRLTVGAPSSYMGPGKDLQPWTLPRSGTSLGTARRCVEACRWRSPCTTCLPTCAQAGAVFALVDGAHSRPSAPVHRPCSAPPAVCCFTLNLQRVVSPTERAGCGAVRASWLPGAARQAWSAVLHAEWRVGASVVCCSSFCRRSPHRAFGRGGSISLSAYLCFKSGCKPRPFIACDCAHSRRFPLHVFFD
jgi:hypothetical protein